MKTTMSITKARINLGAVVKRVAKGELVTLEKGGIPVATLVDPRFLENLEDAAELTRLRNAQALKGKNLPRTLRVALQEIKAGKEIGPFHTIEEFMAGLP